MKNVLYDLLIFLFIFFLSFSFKYLFQNSIAIKILTRISIRCFTKNNIRR